jgi:hypothetical protein
MQGLLKFWIRIVPTTPLIGCGYIDRIVISKNENMPPRAFGEIIYKVEREIFGSG